VTEAQPPPPWYRDGRFVVVAFLVICGIFAGISVLVTLSGQWAPPPEQQAPPIRTLPGR